jgi:hypothetical protein
MSKTLRIARGLIAPVAALCIGLGGAQAQQQDDDRLDEAWKDLFQAQEGILTPKQSAQLNNLAYAAAVARVCDGFTLDQKKFMEGLSAAVEPSVEELTEEQHIERGTAILIDLGMRVGIFMAEGNGDKADFCKEAAESKSDTEAPSYWQ